MVKGLHAFESLRFGLNHLIQVTSQPDKKKKGTAN